MKHYLFSMKMQKLKQKLLDNKEVLQANNFTTQIDVDFDENEDVSLQFLIQNNITSVQKLQ